MLLDEPIASLDIKNQIEIMQTLLELNRQEGVSVLMVLHDINLAGIYCDRLIMLKDGQVIARGNTNECLCEENLKKLYDISFFHVDTKKDSDIITLKYNDTRVKGILTPLIPDCYVLCTLAIFKNIRNPLIFFEKWLLLIFWRVKSSNLLQASLHRLYDLLTLVSYK